MEETYGLFGVEGNGKLKLFDEEVEMILPYAENETFSIEQSANILPKELEQGWDFEDAGIPWFRDGDNFGLQIDQVGVQSLFYAYASRMRHTTIDFDPTYPGEDKILTPSNPNNDDGRFLLRGYESIPFRIEEGSQLFLLGDNFLFDANLTRPDNLAATFRLDPDFTPARVQEIFAPIVDRRVAENPELNESLEIDFKYPQPWERLRTNSLGEIVFFEDKIWESQIDSNVNHRPSKDSAYWKELPGGYSVPTQDWTLTDLGLEFRIYFMAPDGRLFDNQLDALFHTEAFLLKSKIYIADLSTDALAMVNEVTIPFRQFTAEGSGTRGVVAWDSNTQSYKLWAMGADQSEPVTGHYVKGNIVDSTNDPTALLNGSVVLHEERYFVVTDEINLDKSLWSSLNETNLQGGGVALLPNGLPKEGLEKTLLQGTGNSVSGFAGDIVFQRNYDISNYGELVDRYFLALNNYTNVSDLGNSPSFVEVNAFSAMQGSTWASNKSYDSGQIVYYKGSYYEARVDNLKNNMNAVDALGNYQGQFTVFPDDDFYTNEIGELVKNTFWSPVGPSLQYVLSFTLRTGDYPKVSIASAGSNGMDAEAKPVLDASGKLIGLRVNNPGSYAFATGSPVPVPPEFRKAFILYEAQSAEIPIIWGSDSQTGNPQVLGFDLRGLSPLNLEPENVSHNLTFRLLRSHKAELTSHEDSSLAHAVALLDESAIVPKGFLGSAYFSEAKNQAAFDLGSLKVLYPHAPGRTPTAPVEDMSPMPARSISLDMLSLEVIDKLEENQKSDVFSAEATAKITALEQQLEEALKRIDSLEATQSLGGMDPRILAQLGYRQLPDANLSGVDLTNVVLEGADFSGANLKDANLNSTNFTNANLSRANLQGIELGKVEIQDANFSGADLRGADFSQVDFGKAEFRGAHLSDQMHPADFNQSIIDGNLSGLDFSFADFTDSSLRFSSVILEDANFSRSRFFDFSNISAPANSYIGTGGNNYTINARNVDFTDANLSKSIFGYNGVSYDSFGNPSSWKQNINFEGSDFTNADLSEANLSGANLNDVNLNKVNLKGTILTDVSLNFSNGRNLDFTDSDLSGSFSYQNAQEFIGFPGYWGDGSYEFYFLRANGADFAGSDFSGLQLQGADFSEAKLMNVNFSGVDLSPLSLDYVPSEGALTQTVLQKASFRNADLTGVNFSNANLTGVDLKGTNIQDSIFDGAIFSNTIMPDGTVRTD